MTTETIPVVARIAALPAQADALKAILLDVVDATRGEEGCIRYELLQNSADPAEFLTVEEWESDAAIAAHLESAHIQDAIARGQTLFAAPPDIRSYRKVR